MVRHSAIAALMLVFSACSLAPQDRRLCNRVTRCDGSSMDECLFAIDDARRSFEDDFGCLPEYDALLRCGTRRGECVGGFFTLEPEDGACDRQFADFEACLGLGF